MKKETQKEDKTEKRNNERREEDISSACHSSERVALNKSAENTIIRRF
jgi:hypothetical protein